MAAPEVREEVAAPEALEEPKEPEVADEDRETEGEEEESFRYIYNQMLRADEEEKKAE